MTANKEQAASGWKLVPVEPTTQMIDEGAQRLVQWEDGCTWPDSWDALQVLGARNEAERVWRSMWLAASPTASAAQQGQAHGTLIERLDYEVSTGNLTHSENRALLQEARDALAGRSAQWEWFMDESYYGMASVRQVGAKEFGQDFHLNSVAEAEALCALLNSASPTEQQGERGAELEKWRELALRYDAERMALRGERDKARLELAEARGKVDSAMVLMKEAAFHINPNASWHCDAEAWFLENSNDRR